MRILIINGPNINLIGSRETDVYGTKPYGEINGELYDLAKEKDIILEIFQSNHEGEIIDMIHMAPARFDYIIINPGAFTHYSIAIRDAIKSVEIKTIEVHISNIYAREDFRNNSVIAPVCLGQISGFGPDVYKIGIMAAMEIK
jgi:3-dehydroquinate dehydratase II